MTEIVGKMKIMEKRKIKSAEFRNYTHCSQKCFMGWVGFQNYYIILRVGHGKCLRPITRWVGEVKKGQNHAYVIFEWSLTGNKKDVNFQIHHHLSKFEVPVVVNLKHIFELFGLYATCFLI